LTVTRTFGTRRKPSRSDRRDSIWLRRSRGSPNQVSTERLVPVHENHTLGSPTYARVPDSVPRHPKTMRFSWPRAATPLPTVLSPRNFVGFHSKIEYSTHPGSAFGHVPPLSPNLRTDLASLRLIRGYRQRASHSSSSRALDVSSPPKVTDTYWYLQQPFRASRLRPSRRAKRAGR